MTDGWDAVDLLAEIAEVDWGPPGPGTVGTGSHLDQVPGVDALAAVLANLAA